MDHGLRENKIYFNTEISAEQNQLEKFSCPAMFILLRTIETS